MSTKTATWQKVSGICGIMTPSVAFGCILLAISYAPDFNWTNNALSDLGVMQSPTSILFNLGLIAGGILGMVFASGLLTLFKRKLIGELGAIIFVLDFLALTAIGVFPENARPIHLYASVSFFMLFPLSMFLLAASFILASKKGMALLTFSMSIFAAVVWIAEFWLRYVPGFAIPETLSAGAASVWAVVLGVNMVRTSLYSNR
jgi:hypothetical membrane protein